MSHLDQQILQPERIVLQKQAEVKKTLTHLGKLKIHKGQKLFELNLSTAEIEPVVFTEGAVAIDNSVHIKYVIKDNHWYCVAINIKNAQRKFLDRLKSK